MISGLAADVGRLDKVMCTWSLFKLPTIKVNWLDDAILVAYRRRCVLCGRVLPALSFSFFLFQVHSIRSTAVCSLQSWKLSWWQTGRVIICVADHNMCGWMTLHSVTMLIIYWMINECVRITATNHSFPLMLSASLIAAHELPEPVNIIYNRLHQKMTIWCGSPPLLKIRHSGLSLT